MYFILISSIVCALNKDTCLILDKRLSTSYRDSRMKDDFRKGVSKTLVLLEVFPAQICSPLFYGVLVSRPVEGHKKNRIHNVHDETSQNI